MLLTTLTLKSDTFFFYNNNADLLSDYSINLNAFVSLDPSLLCYLTNAKHFGIFWNLFYVKSVVDFLLFLFHYTFLKRLRLLLQYSTRLPLLLVQNQQKYNSFQIISPGYLNCAFLGLVLVEFVLSFAVMQQKAVWHKHLYTTVNAVNDSIGWHI